MSFKLAERDRAGTRIRFGSLISLVVSLVVMCIVIPASLFWFASADAELVQKSILVGAAVAAVAFGVVFGRALSPAKRQVRFRRKRRYGN